MYTDTFAGGGPLNADASGAVTQRARSPMLTSARRPRRPPGYRPPWSSTQQRRYKDGRARSKSGRARARGQDQSPTDAAVHAILCQYSFRIVLKRAIITKDDERTVSITWYLYCLSSWEAGMGARSGASPPPLSVMRFDLLRKVDHVGGAPVCSDQVRRWCDAVAAQVCADAILEVLTEDTHR